MTLKVGYCVFYVAFISIITFFSVSMGIDIVTGVTQDQLTALQQQPTSGNTLIDSLTFLFNLAVFGVTTFGALITLSTEFQILFFFVVLPLSAGFLWAIIELARGN